MPRRETVTQRAYRRRGEAALRSYREAKGGTGLVGGLPPGESRPVPTQRHELGCWVQGLLVAVPLVADAALWYAAGNGYPEVAGLALIGAPIAFMVSFGIANSR